VARGLPAAVKTHLQKARESALMAVDVYNRSGTMFRSGGYIVLMCIAWTALFHAIVFRSRNRPYYRAKNGKRYLKVDGDYKAWELKECVSRYFQGRESPVRRNLEFFVGLRNKIEHRSMPELDVRIFGECQALLFNFEELLVEHFGGKYALGESLSLAIQFSQLRDAGQEKAIRELQKPLAASVGEFIEGFRSSLTADQFGDLKYSYRVFLIPRVANNESQSDLAVEFVRYDPNDTKAMERYSRLVTMIKPTLTEAANVGRLKAGEVCKAVEPVVKQVVGSTARFVASWHHVRACYYYKIRPAPGGGDQTNTNAKYCQYDIAHRDYVYTDAWKDFLIAEMRKPGQYVKVCKAPPST
jgi:Protein of unknown function (DUF3644)